ncbi:MAG: radical SAM protein, partial [bacterium]|nr:radical SAM protein [bacterium]
FFYPHFKTDGTVHIGFYGGEPLMAYDQVRYAVELIQERNTTAKKDTRFSLTTNGTFLTDEMLELFSENRFSLMLRFDGLAQDMGRKKGSIEKTVETMNKIRRYPDIDFEINSVFTPQTIEKLSGSMRFMIEPGGPEITFCLATTVQWNFTDLAKLREQLEKLSDYLVLIYRETGQVPVKNFQFSQPQPVAAVKEVLGPDCAPSKEPVCSAGRGNMTVSPGGHVWGCFMFHDYFKVRQHDPQYRDYSFGRLNEFIRKYGEGCTFSEVIGNYTQLRQNYFKVGESFCFTCEEVDSCMVCPVNAAYTSGKLGQVSCHNCQLEKIERKARKEFVKKIVGKTVTKSDG